MDHYLISGAIRGSGGYLLQIKLIIIIIIIIRDF